jgi:hypothetical protein
MSALRHTAIAICLAGMAMAAQPSTAGPFPTRIAAWNESASSEVIRAQFDGREMNRNWRDTRPPVAPDLGIRLAERGYYPAARYPYYLPYYYYAYPRYSSYEYIYEWYYAPYYRHSGRPY